MEDFPPGLEAIAKNPEDFLLLIDFDGTLVELVDDPRAVTVPPALKADLLKLCDSPLSLVIVTGRPVSTIDRFMGDVKLPVLGGHGVELRIDVHEDATYLAHPLPENLRNTIAEKAHEYGSYVEDKLYSLTVHNRDETKYAALENDLGIILATSKIAFRVRRHATMLEILQESMNKGSGIFHLLGLEKYAGKKLFYIGDDTRTDESLCAVTQKSGTLIAVGTDQTPEGGVCFESPASLRRYLSVLATSVTKTR
jgi:trehalose 6-phosphate phosphatase